MWREQGSLLIYDHFTINWCLIVIIFPYSCISLIQHYLYYYSHVLLHFYTFIYMNYSTLFIFLYSIFLIWTGAYSGITLAFLYLSKYPFYPFLINVLLFFWKKVFCFFMFLHCIILIFSNSYIYTIFYFIQIFEYSSLIYSWITV